MNRLKKVLFTFVLPFFCLLISVSYAEVQTGVQYYPYTPNLTAINNVSSPFNDYTFSEIINISMDYVLDNNNKEQFDNMCSYIDNSGYYIVVYTYSRSSSSKNCDVVIFRKDNGDLGICINQNKNISSYFVPDDYASFEYYWLLSYYPDYILYKNSLSSSEAQANYILKSSDYEIYNTDTLSFAYSNYSVKNLSIDGSHIVWDGESYYYQVGGGEDTPSLPSNAEIASAVQAFYNSDYYKNNKDFKEFFVLYNSLKGIYSFIGHNAVGEIANHFEYGSTLSQIIYSDDYPSNTYGLNYWKFNLETLGSQISNFFNNYYWLYSSYDNGESITYDGKGYVTDLVEVEFDSRYSTIVYSSTNYLCRVYDYENEEETTNDATIPGNQYTYDETLDPTTNEYNPIKDYVSTDPTQSILGDVDFDEINKVFEENKDILNIENASWLFSANNQLINYFIGFLSFLIVLIIISRLLGG